MSHIGKLLYKINDGEYLYKTDYKFLKKNTQNWKHSQNIDDSKVKRIENHIREYNSVDNEIYLFTTGLIEDENSIFQCFDGNHRRMALINIKNKRIPIFVRIFEQTTGRDIMKQFNLNKKSLSKKKYNKLVLEVVEILKKEWGKRYSEKEKSYRPNFNIQMINNDISGIEGIDRLNFNMIINIIFNAYKQFNNELKQNLLWKEQLGANIKKKCIVADCYIFAYDNYTDKLREIIKQQIENVNKKREENLIDLS